MAEKVEVEYFICLMDADDAAYARKNGNKKAKAGDALWRVPISIGPIESDHNHWAGWHLTCTPEQAERVAYLINNDPEFPWDESENA